MTESMSAAQFKASQKKGPKPAKYLSKSKVVDGIPFQSTKEANRYQKLKLMDKAGIIRDLVLQPPFDIIVNNVKICVYNADFTYVKGNFEGRIYEDCKSPATRKKESYRIKKKLVEALYGISILET
jgi:hypothetical protein